MITPSSELNEIQNIALSSYTDANSNNLNLGKDLLFGEKGDIYAYVTGVVSRVSHVPSSMAFRCEDSRLITDVPLANTYFKQLQVQR